jgi:hypothetical protein
MRKISRFLITTSFLIMIFSGKNLLRADPPSPPALPGGHGYGDNIPVGAPIDGGVIILLGLGVGYGARLKMKRNKHLNPWPLLLKEKGNKND